MEQKRSWRSLRKTLSVKELKRTREEKGLQYLPAFLSNPLATGSQSCSYWRSQGFRSPLSSSLLPSSLLLSPPLLSSPLLSSSLSLGELLYDEALRTTFLIASRSLLLGCAYLPQIQHTTTKSTRYLPFQTCPCFCVPCLSGWHHYISTKNLEASFNTFVPLPLSHPTSHEVLPIRPPTHAEFSGFSLSGSMVSSLV